MSPESLREIIHELRRRLKSLQEKLSNSEKKVAAAAAVQLARIAALEKKNQELAFQIAFLEAGGSAEANAKRISQKAAGGNRGGLMPTRKDFTSVAGIIGLLLRYVLLLLLWGGGGLGVAKID